MKGDPMRRALLVALVLILGLGPLAACGKKAPPVLPEGEQLQVQKKGRKQTTGVKTPYGHDGSGSAQPAATPKAGPAPETPAPRDSGQGAEETLPPSPGGPNEGGF
jgi:predicted small lipoprotein YifL